MGSIRLLLPAVAVAGLVGLDAMPARADSNFERGFETELGRIAAHGAVSLGEHWLREVLGVEAHHGRRFRGPGRHDPGERWRHRARPRVRDSWGAWDHREAWRHAERHERWERRHRPRHRHRDCR